MRILVAVDLSDATEKVVKMAQEIAKGLSAEVWLLHVAEPEPDFVGYEIGPRSDRDALSKEFHREHSWIQEIADGLRKIGIDTTALLIRGATAESILKEAGKLGVDMIVLGSYGRSTIGQIMLGSVSAGVLHHSACSVLIVPTR